MEGAQETMRRAMACGQAAARVRVLHVGTDCTVVREREGPTVTYALHDPLTLAERSERVHVTSEVRALLGWLEGQGAQPRLAGLPDAERLYVVALLLGEGDTARPVLSHWLRAAPDKWPRRLERAQEAGQATCVLQVMLRGADYECDGGLYVVREPRLFPGLGLLQPAPMWKVHGRHSQNVAWASQHGRWTLAAPSPESNWAYLLLLLE
jgi:hypothetical protein